VVLLGASETLVTVDHRTKQRNREVVPAAFARAAIDASGLTHRQISDAMGVSEKTVSRWANGHAFIDKWSLASFLEAIGLDRDWQPSESTG
jgi:transcriptional regulator with XRE-family HTH domain